MSEVQDKKDKKDIIHFVVTIIIGLIISVTSFVYYYAFHNPNRIIFGVIFVVDIIMCFISSYKLASFSDGKREKKKAIIYALIAFIIIVLYFGGCQLIVFLFVLKSYTLSFAKQVFLVTLFASPSIIIVLPLIALILSGC